MTAPAPFTYKGHPVPYVTAWDSEHLTQPLVVPARDGIGFDAIAGYPHRDSAGVLWQPWALRQGDGKPEYARVHGPRQRRAMRRRLCQVCGGPSDANEQGRLWLLEDHRGQPSWPEEEVTTHPPVCVTCVPLVLRLCPHMQDAVAVRVGTVTVDGVYGQLYRPGTPLPLRAEKKVVFTGDFQMRWIVGAQLAATLHKCTVVDLAELGVEAPAVRAGARR